MDSLPWFKFNPGQWFMGRIQRCSEITQARFIRLCCVYWNKKGTLSVSDAKDEVGDENYLELLQNKVIGSDEKKVAIPFLDEQLIESGAIEKAKSDGGKIGNLKRWHPEVYKKYEAGEITLEDAIGMRSVSDQSEIGNQSIDKIRQEKKEKLEKENRSDNNEDLISLNTQKTPPPNSAPPPPQKIPFDLFWDRYDKKRSKPKAENLWTRLSLEDQKLCMRYIPRYIESQPDKKYRKDPDVFLRNRSWEDEIIFSNPSSSKPRTVITAISKNG